MSTEIEVNNCFVIYDFSLKNENFATFTFVVKDMFKLQSKTSTDFLTSYSNCYLNIIMYSVLHFQMYIYLLMRNIKWYHKTVFYSLFIQTKINKQTK